jgi:hypothetical protein
MTSNILHRISKKGKSLSLLRQFFSPPAGMIGSMKIGFGVVACDDNGANLFHKKTRDPNFETPARRQAGVLNSNDQTSKRLILSFGILYLGRSNLVSNFVLRIS